MKNKVIFLLFLFAFTSTKIKGQTIVYKYNKQGSCISRIFKETTPKTQKKDKASNTKTKLLKVDISPSPYFQEQLSISALGASSICSLAYIMSNISGQVFFKGLIDKESIILTTTALPKGIYFLKVHGDNFEESYKLLKK